MTLLSSVPLGIHHLVALGSTSSSMPSGAIAINSVHGRGRYEQFVDDVQLSASGGNPQRSDPVPFWCVGAQGASARAGRSATTSPCPPAVRVPGREIVTTY